MNRDTATANQSSSGRGSKLKNVTATESFIPTEFGGIPRDWDLLSISSIADVRDGTHESPRYVRDGVPFVTSKNILSGRIDFSDITYISHEVAQEIDKRSKVDKNDILISMIGTVGNAALVDFEPQFSIKNVGLIKPKNGAYDPRYIAHFLQSHIFRNYLDGRLDGGIQKFISLGMLRNLYLAIPPSLIEQHAIATALSDIDALLEELDRLIAKKRDIKQATMQQLLTGQTRLPGFEGEWEVKSVFALGEIVTGGTPSTVVKEFWGDGYPWITPTDITSSRDMSSSERTLTQAGLNEIKTLPPGTVLVTCIASIGKNAILRGKGGCNQQINALIPNKNSSAEFLYYLFESSRQYLLANAGTTATSIISKATFGSMTFLVPAKDEQIAIANVLSVMDAEITVLKQRSNKARNLKQAMMQELLTGRTRFK